MFQFISKKHKYTIRTFPKSGCSTIRNYFMQAHLDEFSEEDKNKISTRSYHVLQHCKSAVINHIPSGYHSIIILRNPYERILSGYLDLVVGVTNNPRSPNTLKKLGDLENINFVRFLQFILEIGERFYSFDPENYHFREQLGNLDEYKQYDTVLDLGDIEKYSKFLEEKGIYVDKKAHNQINKKGELKPTAFYYNGYTLRDMSIPYESFLTPKIKEYIDKIYPNDTQFYKTYFKI